MSGPADSLICWPGVKVPPVTASRATAFRCRVARCGDTAVINNSGSPQSWSPIVYANGVRSLSTYCTIQPYVRIVSRTSSK